MGLNIRTLAKHLELACTEEEMQLARSQKQMGINEAIDEILCNKIISTLGQMKRDILLLKETANRS
jgi:hypothetical protein